MKLEVLLPIDEVEKVTAEITEGTNGQAGIEKEEDCWFAKIDGEMHIFEE